MKHNQNDTNLNKMRNFGPTKKKKNTYVLHISNLLPGDAVDWYGPTIPVLVLQKNGAISKEEDPFFEPIKSFPNREIQYMIGTYRIARPIMGKLAATVVEYLDKMTDEPILMLFPHSDMPLFLKNFKSLAEAASRLNHASARDLYYQMQHRGDLIKKIRNARRRR